MNPEISKPSCADCRFIATANKHPANPKGSFARGGVTEVISYACTMEPHTVFLFDSQTGFCEHHSYYQIVPFYDGPPNYTTNT